MTENDPLRSDLAASSEFEPARYALSAVVYAGRDDEILLQQRAQGSAMAGQWFLPGGFVEPGELRRRGLDGNRRCFSTWDWDAFARAYYADLGLAAPVNGS